MEMRFLCWEIRLKRSYLINCMDALYGSLGPTIHSRPEYAKALSSSNLVVPSANEIFELTLNGNEIDPMTMLERDEFDPDDFVFEGPKVRGRQTHQFMLVHAFCEYPKQAERVIRKYGKLAEGEWREAFLRKYPHAQGSGPIDFAGSLWRYKGDYGDGLRNKEFWPDLLTIRAGWQLSFTWGAGYEDKWLVKIS